MEYVSKWVEAIAMTTCNAQVVLRLLKKHIFTRYGVPKGLVSDGGSHFCNKQMEKLLHKYGVMYKVATPYHSQTNSQAELANTKLKRILGKTVGATRKDWARKLEELEHKAFWATKLLNLDSQVAGEKRLLQLNELDEFRLEAYENSKIYKEKAKMWLKVFPGKLKSKWTGPYLVTKVFPYGSLELLDEVTMSHFTASGHREKHYLGGQWDKEKEVQNLN
ncbi:uncharacterized protein LOC107484481 [Arachis duranensis]|uniref:Uncharacterized protein LOC107484481 n=1 Tax=Arachis duranensis TaxID=130453 RepID=A0A6P4D2Y0_ARADU|nr:uncharacterized protein LOC107484481 [Arachis duranensis]